MATRKNIIPTIQLSETDDLTIFRRELTDKLNDLIQRLNKPEFTVTLDMGHNRISNVARGVLSRDAVNLEQLEKEILPAFSKRAPVTGGDGGGGNITKRIDYPMNNAMFPDGSAVGQAFGTVQAHKSETAALAAAEPVAIWWEGLFRQDDSLLWSGRMPSDFTPTASPTVKLGWKLEKQLVAGTQDGGGDVRIIVYDHARSTGDVVIIEDVGGTTEANGTFTISSTGQDQFDLNGTTFSNAWTGGGTVKSADISGYGVRWECAIMAVTPGENVNTGEFQNNGSTVTHNDSSDTIVSDYGVLVESSWTLSDIDSLAPGDFYVIWLKNAAPTISGPITDRPPERLATTHFSMIYT